MHRKPKLFEKTLKTPLTFVLFLFLTFFYTASFSQQMVEEYHPLKKDSIRVGTGEKDFFPLIQKGYTLMLPKAKMIQGVLIFLEGSGYDQKFCCTISFY
jgi:hypothetical protein